jgi:poly-gamma-glutamate synthesis protein (capsule biosynthesis protein)
VGFLAYCTPHGGSATAARPGVAPFDSARVRSDVAALRAQADFVVVHAHWGSMYVDDPPPRALDWASEAAGAGADVVVGHHPHVLQGIERRGRTLVMYSLGDLAFDPSAGDFRAEVGREKRREAGIFTVTFAGEAHGLRAHPTTQDDDFVPGAAEGAQGEAILARLRAMSETLGDARQRYARESGPDLLRYELQSLGHHLRSGRWDKVLRLLFSMRPRHVPLLWGALRGGRRARKAARA